VVIVVIVLSEESVENEAIVEGAVVDVDVGVSMGTDVETVTLVRIGTALRASREHHCYRGPHPYLTDGFPKSDSQKKVHQGWGGDRGDTELKDETNGANDASAADPWGATATGEWENPTETAVDSWAADTKAGGDTTDPWATGGGDAAADPWANPTAAGAEGETKDDGEKPAGEEEGKRRKRFDDEEDEGKMTLEEWRAKNAPSDAIPKLEPRKIAEGSSEFFKGAQQLFKTDNDYFVGKVRLTRKAPRPIQTHFPQPKTASAPRQRKEAKQYIEIDARFDPPSRGGRGRGGRGGRSYGDSPRGDRPERGGRGGRGGYGGGGRNQQSKEVDVEDTNAFPSLSAN